MMRNLKNLWFHLVMFATSVLPDAELFMALRGWLVRPSLKRRGRNLQLARGVEIACCEHLSVGNDVYLAYHVWIQADGDVTLEDEVVIGPFTVLASRDHLFKDGSVRFGGGVTAPIRVGRGAWLASHVVVTRWVTIGAGCTIAAGAVVRSDVPDNAVFGGVPARQIGTQETGNAV
ncbi:MAG: acyltransferase [Phycisphaerae bacterium]